MLEGEKVTDLADHDVIAVQPLSSGSPGSFETGSPSTPGEHFSPGNIPMFPVNLQSQGRMRQHQGSGGKP